MILFTQWYAHDVDVAHRVESVPLRSFVRSFFLIFSLIEFDENEACLRRHSILSTLAIILLFESMKEKKMDRKIGGRWIAAAADVDKQF